MLPEPVVATLARVTAELERLSIEYRVVGGIAVHVHGYERSTGDVDLLISPEGHAAAWPHLLRAGFLPKSAESKHLKDIQTGVEVDFLRAGVDRPGSRRAPMTFPSPKDLRVKPGNLPGRHVDLVGLVGLKLLAAKYGETRQQDSVDVLMLLRRNPLPEATADALHPEVREIFRYWWKLAQVKAEDPSTEHASEPVSPYFAETAAMVRRGEISPEEAVKRLVLPVEGGEQPPE